MQVVVTEKPNWRREIGVIIPAEEVAPKLEKLYEDYRKRVKLQGFRKGMIPLNLIKKMFGKEIERAVFDEVISEKYPQIIDEKGLKPIGQAAINEIKYDAQTGLSVKIIIDIEPVFELSNYKGLKLEREIVEVTDAQVEDALERLCQDQAMMSTVDGTAEEGHILVVDLQKLDVTGVPIIGSKHENRYLELVEKGGASAPYSLVKQLLGVKAGEKRRIRVGTETTAAPMNTQSRKDDEFYEVAVKEVQKREVPKIDDEFAKDIGDYNTLKELKAALRDNLKIQNETRGENAFRQHVMDQVIKNNEIEVPQLMIDNYLRALVEAAQEKGGKRYDEQELKEEFRADAIWRIKWSLLQDKIIQQEHIVVSEEDVGAEIEKLLTADSPERAQNEKYYKTEKGRNRVKNELLEERVLKLIIDNAKVKTRKIKYKKEDESSLIVTPT